MDRLVAMRQFVAVVDAGSFSAASRLLEIGQPAVSKTIAALEARLGVRLLVRTTRSHSLTDAGQRYYARAKIALDEADAAEADARDEAAALVGRLRVSAPPVYASLQIVPRLSAFFAAYPGLQLDLVLDDRRIDLVEEGVDLAIRAGELGDSSLVATRIDSARRLVAGTPDYLARHGVPAAPAELTRHAVVTFTGFQGPTAWTFRRGSARVSVTVEAALRVSAAEGLRAAVKAGLGLGMVSERMVGQELADGALVEVLGDWSLPRVDVWAIYPAGRRPPARARALVAWLTAALHAAHGDAAAGPVAAADGGETDGGETDRSGTDRRDTDGIDTDGSDADAPRAAGDARRRRR